MWHGREHMGGMRMMMKEKMMEDMSKEDMKQMAALMMDKKIAILEVKLEYAKKVRDMMKSKM
ncbi:MAG: hypothetical protein HVN34_05890 [Methanobacteriaceae archaeon]|jgi:hypothetical protein|nr:hypothetical protein [Methanobacteriaceae archaeon]OPY23307.1 MAG: hypothetical protein A4E26_00917 [Methanobacterium sp. PtaU1.Bin097]